MAYAITSDERSYGTGIASSAGARDAPYSLAATYWLAAGFANAGYGATIPPNYVLDNDVYSLGSLEPGQYTVKVSGSNWDYSNSIYGNATPSLQVTTSTGTVLGSSIFGSYTFNVDATGTFFAVVIGTTYASNEYQIYYTYDGALPSAVNYVAVWNISVAGSLVVGSTISAAGSWTVPSSRRDSVGFFDQPQG